MGEVVRKVNKVLVIGGGITGLTLAVALRKKGIEVDLVEIKPDLTGAVGVGLTLMHNALLVLDRIGVVNACIDAGMPAYHFNMCGPDGSVIREQPTGLRGGQLPGHVSMSRGALHRILIDAALNEGTKMRMGVTAVPVGETGESIDLSFSDGSTGTYDVVVGADGVRSAMRERLFPEVEVKFTGLAIWRAAVPRPEQIQTSHLHLGGEYGVVGICPISKRDAYLYIVESAADRPWLDDSRLHEIMQAKLATGYNSLVVELAHTLKSSENISYRPIEWHLVSAPWYCGRQIILGDAAHTNPPVLAQGAAMGMEDAVVLADLLAECDLTSDALEEFMRRRIARVKTVVENSVLLAKAEVEHDADLDIGAIFAQTAAVLAQPL
ncbi:FAD-dependent oxidoreductase [Paraburkholderia sp.]|uniref:FAD-dependent oxidoreductase n=1 Tax=Paraburkholderia sp. TaxID=1926495 RepID=UPI003C7B22C8